MPRSKQKKIIAILSGGLGNQLYQYAFASHLAQKYNASLSFDAWSGFLNDPYQRSYQLAEFFPGQKKESMLSVLISLLMAKLSSISYQLTSGLKNFFKEKPPWFVFVLGNRILLTELRPFTEEVILDTEFHSLRVRGYFQSKDLFKNQFDRILYATSFYQPYSQSLLILGAQLRRRATIAVGIRLYEETPEPEANAHNSMIKPLDSLDQALNEFLQAHPGSQVAVFCTHRSPLLNKLRLPSSTIYLTGDDQVSSAHDTLWLMSQCQHHIFLNSSLYWWAAFLSRLNHDPNDQIILAADNFINQSCYLDGWSKF